jgi:hypothetical protein
MVAKMLFPIPVIVGLAVVAVGFFLMLRRPGKP